MALLHAEITDQVIGAFFEVYRRLGYGFLETPYKNALAVELGFRGLKVAREVPVEIQYRGVGVGIYRIDMLVETKVLIEAKASTALSEADDRQLMNYLRATDVEVGLLLHFGPEPKYRRRVYSNTNK